MRRSALPWFSAWKRSKSWPVVFKSGLIPRRTRTSSSTSGGEPTASVFAPTRASAKSDRSQTGRPLIGRLLECLVLFDRANDLGDVAARFHQDKLTRRARIGRHGARHADGIPRQIQDWRSFRAAIESDPDILPFGRLVFPPALWKIIALNLLGVDGENRFGFLRQPFPFLRGLKDERENDNEQDQQRENAEIEFPKLLFIDLAREHRQLRGVLRMPIHGRAVLLNFREQMGRVRRSDSLRSKMTADVEVGGVLLFFDGLMMAAGVLESVLLGAAVLIQDAVARFKFIPDPRDVFVHDVKLGLVPRQFLPGHSAGVRAAEAGARDFRAFFRETDPARADRGHLRFKICGRGNLGLQFGQFFQELPVGRVVVLEPALHAGQFAVAKIGRGLGVIPPFEDRFLFFLEFGQRGVLLFRVLRALQLNFPDALFNLRDAQRDFFLFLLELLQRHDFVADFGKIDRLRTTLAAEIDFAFLQNPLFMAQSHPRFLPPNFQPDLAQACSNETHGIRLRWLRPAPT